MSLTRIRELISARTGLQPDSLGASAVPNAVDGRMRLLNVGTTEGYADRLGSDPQEFQALVDAIIVPETWFFRGGALYDALVKQVQRRSTENPTRPFKVLSLPCSTGEEPYSIVMALTDAGLAANSWSIDAIDLSSASIAVARVGRYREFSFRETTPELRARHFTPVGDQFELRATLRDKVRFRVGNLLDPASLASFGERYDLVLCRNLMIYLTPQARRAALETLEQRLAPEGILAVGHAEAGNLLGTPFDSIGPEGCFLFQRKVPTATVSRPNLILQTTTLKPLEPLAPPVPVVLRTKVTETKVPLPTLAEAPADCWNHIGVRGDRSCPLLPPVVHCQNCSVFSAAGRRFLDAPSPPGYLDEWTERLARPIEAEPDDLVGLLIFRLAEEWLALPLDCLVEVTASKSVHRVPHRAGVLAGVVNIRGELTLCAHLWKILGLPVRTTEQPASAERMLVLRRNTERWVLRVDSVEQVFRLPQAEVGAAPATIGRAASHLTRGVFTWENRSVGLLDDDRLFEALRVKLR